MSPHHFRIRTTLAVGVLGALALTGCSASSGGDAGASEDGKVTVVTSTNVYADLVSQIGGDAVDVTPVIASVSQDPHSYEASPQDRLRVSGADLVVRNGGGYDQFMTDLASENQHVVDAVEASGLQPEEDVHDDHDLDLYGDLVRLEFVDFQRPTLKFDSIEALITQMTEDVEVTRRTLADETSRPVAGR